MTEGPPHYEPGDKIRVTYRVVPQADCWDNGVVLEMIGPGVARVEWDAGHTSTINLYMCHTEKRA
jgi:hypothetical protein